MSVRTVLVCGVQVPLVHGGAEILVSELVSQLQARGYESELVSLPFKWYPKEEIFAHAAAWRCIDLCEANGRRIDCVIATKFPSYFVRHPNKVDLAGAPASRGVRPGRQPLLPGLRVDRERRRQPAAAVRSRSADDRRGEAGLHDRRRADRPPREVQRHPRAGPLPAAEARRRLRPGPFGDYFLSVGRLETLKRVDLAIRALALVPPPACLVVVGDGTQRDALRPIADEAGVADRVEFVGSVDDDTLVRLYAGARAVVFAPFDEDYGYVTLEAFLSGKPVVTAARFRAARWNSCPTACTGLVCEPAPAAVADAMARPDVRPRRAAGSRRRGARARPPGDVGRGDRTAAGNLNVP